MNQKKRGSHARGVYLKPNTSRMGTARVKQEEELVLRTTCNNTNTFNRATRFRTYLSLLCLLTTVNVTDYSSHSHLRKSFYSHLQVINTLSSSFSSVNGTMSTCHSITWMKLFCWGRCVHSFLRGAGNWYEKSMRPALFDFNLVY